MIFFGGGARTANFAEIADADYYIYLSRAGEERKGFAWRIGLREKLPTFGIPLKIGDEDAALDLQSAFDQAYELGSYDLDINYDESPILPLADDENRWARDLIRRWRAQKPS